jgi:hypothetical protein
VGAALLWVRLFVHGRTYVAQDRMSESDEPRITLYRQRLLAENNSVSAAVLGREYPCIGTASSHKSHVALLRIFPHFVQQRLI